ncbi:hypothetical protein G9A89_013961 [Geosiphon pyriformis]|nr:hypothetical protein G9A89_013961 [Geosiphon pyriformis]
MQRSTSEGTTDSKNQVEGKIASTTDKEENNTTRPNTTTVKSARPTTPPFRFVTVNKLFGSLPLAASGSFSSPLTGGFSPVKVFSKRHTQVSPSVVSTTSKSPKIFNNRPVNKLVFPAFTTPTTTTTTTTALQMATKAKNSKKQQQAVATAMVQMRSLESLTGATKVAIGNKIFLTTFKIAWSSGVASVFSLSLSVALHNVLLGTSSDDIKTALGIFGLDHLALEYKVSPPLPPKVPSNFSGSPKVFKSSFAGFKSYAKAAAFVVLPIAAAADVNLDLSGLPPNYNAHVACCPFFEPVGALVALVTKLLSIPSAVDISIKECVDGEQICLENGSDVDNMLDDVNDNDKNFSVYDNTFDVMMHLWEEQPSKIKSSSDQTAKWMSGMVKNSHELVSIMGASKSLKKLDKPSKVPNRNSERAAQIEAALRKCNPDILDRINSRNSVVEIEKQMNNLFDANKDKANSDNTIEDMEDSESGLSSRIESPSSGQYSSKSLGKKPMFMEPNHKKG